MCHDDTTVSNIPRLTGVAPTGVMYYANKIQVYRDNTNITNLIHIIITYAINLCRIKMIGHII